MDMGIDRQSDIPPLSLTLLVDICPFGQKEVEDSVILWDAGRDHEWCPAAFILFVEDE